jgi:hypothetical protein
MQQIHSSEQKRGTEKQEFDRLGDPADEAGYRRDAQEHRYAETVEATGGRNHDGDVVRKARY